MVARVSADGDTYIASRTVHESAHLFRASNNANIAKVSRLWKCRGKYLQNINSQGGHTLRETHSSITRPSFGSFKPVDFKTSRKKRA